MPKDKNKKFNLEVKSDEVVHTTISTSKRGYNYASVVVKTGDKEYMNISYEWEGENIPYFAMELMSMMQNNKMETSGVWEGKEEDYKEYSSMKGD